MRFSFILMYARTIVHVFTCPEKSKYLFTVMSGFLQEV